MIHYSSSTASSEAPTEWLRLPKPRHRVEGLSRSHLNTLILPTKENGNSPPVHSIALKKRGATRGIRLIHKPSLLAYLSSLGDVSSTSVPRQ